MNNASCETSSETDGHATELLFLDNAYAKSMDATVLETREDGAVALDRTVFYATGGGQPHDSGTLRLSGGEASGETGEEAGGDTASEVFVVTDVRKQDDLVWHSLATPDGAASDETAAVPTFSEGDKVTGNIDWDRRHQLMRTHTALHILGGVIWNEWSVYVTGGNMEPLAARMDFEFGQLPDNFASHVSQLVNKEIAADRPIEVSYLDSAVAQADKELIRTKVNLVPKSVKRIRVVDIVGLDKQADGGTHVASTLEVGRFEITKTESKGKGNKRVRMVLHDS